MASSLISQFFQLLKNACYVQCLRQCLACKHDNIVNSKDIKLSGWVKKGNSIVLVFIHTKQ